MADGNAQADIRGLDIDKLAKGFADEDNVFKAYVQKSKTKAREMRWYQKTSGFLDVETTTGITGSQIDNFTSKARPFTTEQTWTRQTSYVRKYMVESPWISIEDISDSDVSLMVTNTKDLTRAVSRKVDARIYNVITEDQSPSTINTTAATGTGWDDVTNGNPVLDILTGEQKIRSFGYNGKEAIIVMNSIENKFLLNWLITVKGSSFPQYSSDKIGSGVVMDFMGHSVVISENAPTDSVAMWIPNRSATWRDFMGISAVTLDDPGVAKKIRVWEEGECILTDPKSVHLTTDTIT